MTSEIIKQKISDGVYDIRFEQLYPASDIKKARERYTDAINSFADLYGDGGEIAVFSVSGRSELAGNHTDHNHGAVIAASIDLDIIAVARKRNDNTIRLKSEGFAENRVDTDDFSLPDEGRSGQSDSLIAGVCAGFRLNNLKAGGFDAYTTSNVLKGSGLSSSAAFEDMIGNILNHLYNDASIGYIEISKISQYAENKFFGKPCGLMDQVACAAGGIVSIDFKDPSNPVVEKLDFDINAKGYCLCIVDTGGNHADLTADYAAVPAEMKAIAAELGKECLRDVDEQQMIAKIPLLRSKCGDRAILRAMHFFEENRRVAMLKDALKKQDLDRYFEGVTESGRSSFCYLQNVYTNSNVCEQGLSLALCLAEKFLNSHKKTGKNSAFRVHGGGFAGTIQAYVPSEDVGEFKMFMDSVFGENACTVLHIRREGAVRVI